MGDRLHRRLEVRPGGGVAPGHLQQNGSAESVAFHRLQLRGRNVSVERSEPGAQGGANASSVARPRPGVWAPLHPPRERNGAPCPGQGSERRHGARRGTRGRARGAGARSAHLFGHSGLLLRICTAAQCRSRTAGGAGEAQEDS